MECDGQSHRFSKRFISTIHLRTTCDSKLAAEIVRFEKWQLRLPQQSPSEVEIGRLQGFEWEESQWQTRGERQLPNCGSSVCEFHLCAPGVPIGGQRVAHMDGVHTRIKAKQADLSLPSSFHVSDRSRSATKFREEPLLRRSVQLNRRCRERLVLSYCLRL